MKKKRIDKNNKKKKKKSNTALLFDFLLNASDEKRIPVSKASIGANYYNFTVQRSIVITPTAAVRSSSGEIMARQITSDRLRSAFARDYMKRISIVSVYAN